MSDDITLADIEIEEFIFHITIKGEDKPILMESTPIGGFERFFKERIKEIHSGNRFDFIEGSNFYKTISNLNANPDLFLSISKEIAIDFHGRHDKRANSGVMMFIKAQIFTRVKYILIKYDNEDVVTYNRNGQNATLAEITNTFSKSKQALQKSAIIEIMDSNPYAIIIDHSDRKDVTQLFKGFLGIKRKYSEKDLTEKVLEAFIATSKSHKTDLPSSFTSSQRQRYYDLVQTNDSFTIEEFLPMAFGEHSTPEIAKTFRRELKNKRIEGEEFNYYKKIEKPKDKKYKTKEGVSIQYGDNADDTVIIVKGEEETTITITTKQLFEE